MWTTHSRHWIFGIGMICAFLPVARMRARTRGCEKMPLIEDRLVRSALTLVPTTIVVLGIGISLLPADLFVRVLSALGAWLSLSLPIGIFVGHCVLDGTDRR